jgi:aspartyl-tRNA(Asn)/glutamyl-tRNA(Gln) amidotransferase subunit C
VTDVDIDHLSQLAQLELGTGTREAARADLERIVRMIDAMQAVDTDGVEPLAHPLEGAARLRRDEVTEQVDREQLQAGAPATEDGLYLVPRVVE